MFDSTFTTLTQPPAQLPAVHTAPSRSGWVPPITQAELQQLTELAEQHRKYEQLRKSIRERWEKHASVEPGGLGLRVSEREHRSFSFAKLVEIGGRAWAEDVRNRIAPTRSIWLKVIRR